MIAQLDDESMQFVVTGEHGRSGGVYRCDVSPRPHSYDHKRHYQLREAGTPVNDRKLQVWDFVVFRDDNTGVRLHPQWSKRTVETFEVEGHPEEVEPPAKGYGQSWGRGTYRFYRDTGTKRMLKFDWRQEPVGSDPTRPFARSRGRSSGSSTGPPPAAEATPPPPQGIPPRPTRASPQ